MILTLQQSRAFVATAIRSGVLVPPLICEDCKLEKKVEAHHEDYQKPLKVIWLCRLCHKQVHKKPAKPKVIVPEVSFSTDEKKQISEYLSEIGKRGGKAKSKAKQKAAKQNGSKGGAPRKVFVTTAGESWVVAYCRPKNRRRYVTTFDIKKLSRGDVERWILEQPKLELTEPPTVSV